MLDTGAPEVLWDYCLEWCALVRSHSALNLWSLKGQTPMTKMLGQTADISFLAEFGFYEWVWYLDQEGVPGLDATDPGTTQKARLNSMGRKKLGRYLGPDENVGDKMCATVLTEIGTTRTVTSIIPLTAAEKQMDSVRRAKHVYESHLARKLRQRIKEIQGGKPAKKIEEKDLRIEEELTPIAERV